MNRSATTELDLEAGQYLVMIKITASRDKSRKTPEEIVKKTCQTRPDKLMAVGLSYDLAHAKGHLKESGLERKDRLRKERRDKKRMNARKTFEAQKLLDKKEKLRRLRLEAKAKAKRDNEPKDDQHTNNGIEISIRMGESTLKPSKSQSADDAVGGSKVVSQEGTSKQLKIIVEACDKAESTTGGDQTTSGEIKQPITGEDQQALKQALEGNNQGETEHTDATATSAPESGQDSEKARSTATASTSGKIPATSASSSSATEGSDKTEGQPSAKLDEKAIAGEKVTDTKASTGIGGSTNESNAINIDVQLQNLTLDNISDDGLSWFSDVDVPSDSSSNSDSDSDTDEPAPAPTDPAFDQPADEVANDPWNAVCVFGLRVYSKGSQAEIEVVKKQDDDESAGSKKLDVDDQAADATKKLQKGSAKEEQQLENVGTAPAWAEESKQG